MFVSISVVIKLMAFFVVDEFPEWYFAALGV